MVWKLIAFLALIFVLALGIWMLFGDAIINLDDNDEPDISSEFSMRIDSLAKCLKEGREETALLRYKIEMLNLKFDMSRQEGKYLVVVFGSEKALPFFMRELAVLGAEADG